MVFSGTAVYLWAHTRRHSTFQRTIEYLHIHKLEFHVVGQDNSLARLPIKIISVKIQLLGSQMSQLSGEWSGLAG